MAFPTFYCDNSHLAAPCKEMEVDLAEAVGFEPTVPVKYNGFQDRRNRPLCHASAGGHHFSPHFSAGRRKYRQRPFAFRILPGLF